MKALQLQYTSCRRGRSGSAGFQVRTMSNGITPEEQREIERRGVYRPPRDAPEEASVEIIQRDFPVALRFHGLESGRYALIRSCYTGRDYSGRWGNYFAHTLVFDQAAMPEMWPIDYYEWAGWKGRLEPAEDTEDEPPPLPPVELSGVEGAESFRFEELAEFLREEPFREELLARMGRAVLLGQEDSRAIVIRDSPANNAYWIACLQKLFPPGHAVTLSYSTYQEDPRDCAGINATTGETGFSFGESERRYQFYMFDLTTGVHSEVPELTDYPAMAARWLAQKPSEAVEFYRFMGSFRHCRVEPQLLSAVHLFELSRYRQLDLGGEVLAGVLDFVTRWCREESKAEMVGIVASAISKLGRLSRMEDYSSAVEFVAEGAAATGRQEHRQLAFDIWLQLIDEYVVAQGSGLELARACGQSLETSLPSYREEWAENLLRERRWKRWQPRLSQLNPEILLFLFRLSWKALDLCRRHPVAEQPQISHLLSALGDGEDTFAERVAMVLGAIPLEPGALTTTSRRLAQATDAASTSVRLLTVGRVLGRVLSDAPTAVAQATRHRLNDKEGWELLFGEWQEICLGTENRIAAFGRYREEVLLQLPDFDRGYGAKVALFLLDHLPESEAVTLALSWLRHANRTEFSEEIVRRCLELVNHSLDLGGKPRDVEPAARVVAKAAREYEIALEPNKPFLLQALAEVGGARREEDLRLSEVREALRRVGAADYRVFLTGFLGPALAVTSAREPHRRVLTAVLRPEHPSLFETVYRDFFRTFRKGRWPEALQGALKVWVYLDMGKAAERPLARFEKSAIGELVRCLSRLPSSRYQTVQKSVSPRQERAQQRWQNLCAAVDRRRQGPLARLRGFLFRKSVDADERGV